MISCNAVLSCSPVKLSAGALAGSKFTLGYYLDANGQERPEYQLVKREILYVDSKFNDEARAILVLRWEEMELERQMPTTFKELAELTGKMHKHVLIDCDNLNENYTRLGMDEISSVKYKAENG